MKENGIGKTPETGETEKKIREILGIDPGEDCKKTDACRLKLEGLTQDECTALLPYLGEVDTLYLSQCTLACFSDLLRTNPKYLYLDQVTLLGSDPAVTRELPYEVRFSNMNFDAGWLSGFREKGSRRGHKQLHLQNCHVDNIQELGGIAGLSILELENITFTCSPCQAEENPIRRIIISGSQFENLSFVPSKNSVEDLEFSNCTIGSFRGIRDFGKLQEITIDTDTVVEDRTEQENPSGQEIICRFEQKEKPFVLENVAALKNYIHRLYLIRFREKKIKGLAEFGNIRHLLFHECEFFVRAFVAVARQIKSIEATDSAIRNHSELRYFTELDHFEFSAHDQKFSNARNFSKLLPLKRQLKGLSFYEYKETGEKRSDYPFEKFKALETLKVGYEVSVKTAESILKLKKLKKLDLSVKKTKKVFNLGGFRKLESLTWDSGAGVTGFGHLKRLRSLTIANGKRFDIRALPEMKSLKLLEFSGYDGRIRGLDRFPNLEFLKIRDAEEIHIRGLKKLRVLDLCNSRIKDFTFFGKLPALEKLDLSCIEDEIDLTGMEQFPGLKKLSLMENYELKDISGLEPLKKLEYLDLYHTRVTDVRVLNTLPALKEINLAVRERKNDLEAQLDRPEIAVYCGLPDKHLWIWQEDKFAL